MISDHELSYLKCKIKIASEMPVPHSLEKYGDVKSAKIRSLTEQAVLAM